MINLVKKILIINAFAVGTLLLPLMATANVCIYNDTTWGFGAWLKGTSDTGSTGTIHKGDTDSITYASNMSIILKKETIGADDEWTQAAVLYPDGDGVTYRVTGTIGALSWHQEPNTCALDKSH